MSTDPESTQPQAAPVEDLSVIVPAPGRVTFTYTNPETEAQRVIVCRVAPMKARQFLALMNIVTGPLGLRIAGADIPWEKPEEAAQRLGALLIVTIPSAVDEFITWLRWTITPTKDADLEDLNAALWNPDMDDLIPAVEAVLRMEMPNLARILGNVRSLFQRLEPQVQASLTR